MTEIYKTKWYRVDHNVAIVITPGYPSYKAGLAIENPYAADFEIIRGADVLDRHADYTRYSPAAAAELNAELDRTIDAAHAAANKTYSAELTAYMDRTAAQPEWATAITEETETVTETTETTETAATGAQPDQWYVSFDIYHGRTGERINAVLMGGYATIRAAMIASGTYAMIAAEHNYCGEWAPVLGSNILARLGNPPFYAAEFLYDLIHAAPGWVADNFGRIETETAAELDERSGFEETETVTEYPKTGYFVPTEHNPENPSMTGFFCDRCVYSFWAAYSPSCESTRILADQPGGYCATCDRIVGILQPAPVVSSVATETAAPVRYGINAAELAAMLFPVATAAKTAAQPAQLTRNDQRAPRPVRLCPSCENLNNRADYEFCAGCDRDLATEETGAVVSVACYCGIVSEHFMTAAELGAQQVIGAGCICGLLYAVSTVDGRSWQIESMAAAGLVDVFATEETAAEYGTETELLDALYNWEPAPAATEETAELTETETGAGSYWDGLDYRNHVLAAESERRQAELAEFVKIARAELDAAADPSTPRNHNRAVVRDYLYFCNELDAEQRAYNALFS